MRMAGVLGLRRICAALPLVALLFGLGGRAALAQHEHEHSSGEFEVFVATDGLLGPRQLRPRVDDSWLEADVVFGLTHDQFRVFGEYFITTEERDLERFQLGYEFVPNTVVWLGRFHQPASAWNTEHHHGRYLQTAITRPSIESWEDEQGVIPQHITGALIESRQQLGDEAGLQLSAGVGAGPALSNDNYQPIEVLKTSPGKHGLSLTARVAYLPEFVGTSSAGLLWGRDQVFVRSRVALAELRSNHVMLDIYGAYVDWTVEPWRIIGALYDVEAHFDAPLPAESFASGYLQAERQLPHSLTAFGRVEDSSRLQKSRYVALFDDHNGDIDLSVRRLALGLRWDYARRQELSCELAHVVALPQRGNELRLQWSAAIP